MSIRQVFSDMSHSNAVESIKLSFFFFAYVSQPKGARSRHYERQCANNRVP